MNFIRSGEDIYTAIYNADKDLLEAIIRDDKKQISLRFDVDNNRLGYDVEGKWCSPLEILIANSDIQKETMSEMFSMLVEAGADINQISTYEGNTMLHTVADTGNVHILKELINAGLDINAIDENGNTPLHLAVSNLKLESVKELIKNGAEDSLVIQNKDYQLPINSVKVFFLNDEKYVEKIKAISEYLSPLTEKALEKEFELDSNTVNKKIKP